MACLSVKEILHQWNKDGGRSQDPPQRSWQFICLKMTIDIVTYLVIQLAHIFQKKKHLQRMPKKFKNSATNLLHLLRKLVNV